MLLRFTDGAGMLREYAFKEGSVTIGRSPDADISLADDKASRMHCDIHFDKGLMILRDLKAKNGTYLNDRRIESEVLRAGDRFRAGRTVFRVLEEGSTGQQTAVNEVEEQMADGKGYHTILREIVENVDAPDAKGKSQR